MMDTTSTRRHFLKATGAAATTLALAGSVRRPLAAATADKPNILFMMVDDLGKEWVSCYGSEEMKTPNLDKLAAGGMRFTNAYSMPKCTPTRTTLLTGQYPFRHGWIGHWDVPRWGAGCHFDPEHNVAFGRVMQSAGYTTAVAGKWQINDFRVQPDVLQRHGFDEHCMWTGAEGGNGPSGQRYWDPYVFTSDGVSKTYEGKFGPDIYTDFLIDFMGRHKAEPMMMYFPMALTHGPLVHTPLDPDVTDSVDKHKAMVRYTDHLLGRLVKAIDDLGIRKRTIVIFTTDNGTSRGLKGRMNGRLVTGGKDLIGENGVCEPYIVNGPGIVPAGVVTDALTDFTDLLPTFAELGGAKLPEGQTIDGKSIAKLITGKAKDSPREWIMAMGAGTMNLTPDGVRPKTAYGDRVVRDKQWKLWVLDGKGARLHDLQADPGEETNLLDSAAPEAVAARKRLEAVVAGFPKQDGHPRYDPTPPQKWDKTLAPAGEAKGKRPKKPKKE